MKNIGQNGISLNDIRDYLKKNGTQLNNEDSQKLASIFNEADSVVQDNKLDTKEVKNFLTLLASNLTQIYVQISKLLTMQSLSKPNSVNVEENEATTEENTDYKNLETALNKKYSSRMAELIKQFETTEGVQIEENKWGDDKTITTYLLPNGKKLILNQRQEPQREYLDVLDENGKKQESLSIGGNCLFEVNKLRGLSDPYMAYREDSVQSHIIYDENGKIKSFTAILPESEDGNPAEIVMGEVQYDKNGNKISYIEEGIEKEFNKKNIKVENYNSQGEITSTVYERFNTKNINNKEFSSYDKTETIYNSDGSFSEYELSKDSQGAYFSSVTKHNKNKELIYYSSENSKKGISKIEIYEGPNIAMRKGRIPNKAILTDGSGNIKSITTNKFDDRGVLLSCKVEYPQDSAVEVFKSEFDKKFTFGEQGAVGNCYMLASINALNSTDEGKKFLEELIEDKVVNGETVYSIKFKGISKIKEYLEKHHGIPQDKNHLKGEYIITQKELDEIKLKAGKNYSKADVEYLILERAYEKYREDCKKNREIAQNASMFDKNIAGIEVTTWATDSLSGGFSGQSTFVIAGKMCTQASNKTEKIPVVTFDINGNLKINDSDPKINPMSLNYANGNTIKENITVLDAIKRIQKVSKSKSSSLVVTASFLVSQQIVNGVPMRDAGHAFTIKSIDNNKVVLINPWDSTQEVTMSLEDFKKAVMSIEIADLKD